MVFDALEIARYGYVTAHREQHTTATQSTPEPTYFNPDILTRPFSRAFGPRRRGCQIVRCSKLDCRVGGRVPSDGVAR